MELPTICKKTELWDCPQFAAKQNCGTAYSLQQQKTELSDCPQFVRKQNCGTAHNLEGEKSCGPTNSLQENRAVGLPTSCKKIVVGLPTICNKTAVALPTICKKTAVGLPTVCKKTAAGLPTVCKKTELWDNLQENRTQDYTAVEHLELWEHRAYPKRCCILCILRYFDCFPYYFYFFMTQTILNRRDREKNAVVI